VRRKTPRTVEDFAVWLELEPENLPMLRRALTHRSQSEGALYGDNERLEFFGDSILAMLVCEYLYEMYPDRGEGDLTKMKANLVSEPSLAAAARELNLGLMIDMSRGEEVARGRDRPGTLADAFEAVLAALYLCRGLDRARWLVREHLIARTDETREWDYKSALQEYLQETRRTTPQYVILEEQGPAHAREFIAEVRIGEDLLGTGRGRSKKQAQQIAAAEALSGLVGSISRALGHEEPGAASVDGRSLAMEPAAEEAHAAQPS
jgi:ribonuclease-3